MGKLNRKGFTLVELLAVIVILAIIIALVFPQVSNVLNSSKVSTIYSNSKVIVKWWELQMVSDKENSLIPDGMQNSLSEEWQCMGNVSATDGTKFYEMVNLSENDFVFVGDVPVDGKAVTNNTCSAVRYFPNSGLEVLLVAKEGGKNYTAGMVTYGFSTATGGNMAPKSE